VHSSMKKKSLYVVAAIVLIFVVTNPNVKQFNDFLKSEDFYRQVEIESRVRTARSSNFFVFSFFTVDYMVGNCINCDNTLRKGYYVGVFGNFFNREVK
jgi:hypothetical protein